MKYFIRKSLLNSPLARIFANDILISSGVPTHSNGLKFLTPKSSSKRGNKDLSSKRFCPKISKTSFFGKKAASCVKTKRHFAHLAHHLPNAFEESIPASPRIRRASRPP